MPECDCRRPVTPDGIYHESTCALRLTERDRDLAAENDRLRRALAPFVYPEGCEGLIGPCKRGEAKCQWCAARDAVAFSTTEAPDA